MLPTIAIVGRPNVGKSSLLNMLARRRVSIVEPTAGVTRDRVNTTIEIPPAAGEQAAYAQLIDTGGYGLSDTADARLTAGVERQITRGLAQADVVLFVVDAQAGVLPLDEQVARLLRAHGPGPASQHCSRAAGGGDAAANSGADSGVARPSVLLVANKVDDQRLEAQAWEMMELGFGEPAMVSATTGHNRHALYARLRKQLEAVAWRHEGEAAAPPEAGVRLAVVGKPNAGKSTLVNALAGDERVLVSEQAGTTRDAVDVRFELPPRPGSDAAPQVFTAIDTGGLRRRKSVKSDIEYYTMHRALRSIRRADVCLLVVDAAVALSHVDHKLVGEILTHHRPAVIVVNKWDLAEHDHTQQQYMDYLDRRLRGLAFAPVVFVSAHRPADMRDVLAVAHNLHEQARHRVSTGRLNQAIQTIASERGPSSKGGKQARIYYATQLDVNPPTIGLFVNAPELFGHNYQLFLLNRLRDVLPFSEVPIKLLIRASHRAPAGAAPR